MATINISYLPGERWETIRGKRSAYGEKYAISNHGRLAKFTDSIKKGSILKGSLQEGYPIWRFKKNGKHKHYLLHRLVASYFLPKPNRRQKFVLHLNFNKKDNHYKNLQWASQEEATAHQFFSPAVKRAKIEMRKKITTSPNTKLTIAKVSQIKKLLAKGKTLKTIAERFNVSDMQIYRIKIGENWKNVQ